ncbi:MAG TPA: hypothetical protein VFF29_01020 [Bacteroidota bacterium]|nr:hypothetical protein [Bacteroidota bacterium]
MVPQKQKRSTLINELVEYFLVEGFDIIAAKDVIGYHKPVPVVNDGYGDQKDKVPDILAYDQIKKCFIVGIVRVDENEFDSEESLTEYNVFLDQKDKVTGEPHRLFIMIPSAGVNTMTSLITHYIHREYWHRVMIVTSKLSTD